MEFGRGIFGDARPGDREFTVDVFGLEHKFLQVIGRTYKEKCDATLGDDRCKVSLTNYTETGSVSAIVSQHEIQCSITNTNGKTITDEDWFADGKLTWTSGANINLILEIQSSNHTAGVFTLTFKEDAHFSIQAGNAFTIAAGCRGRKTEDCKTKFNNLVQFRGFDKLPGQDVLSYTPTIKTN